MKDLTSVIYNVCDTAGTKLHQIYVALCQQEIGKLQALQRINEVRDSLVHLLDVKGKEMTRTAKKRLIDMINLSNNYIRKIG